MNKDNYITLIYKQLKGEISLEEQNALDQWMSADPSNEKLVEDIENDWGKSKNYEPKIEVDLDAEFGALKERINAKEVVAPKQEAKIRQLEPKRPNRRRWLSWAAAAAIALAIGASWFLNQPQEMEWLSESTTGDEKKSVVLADGSTVVLNENSTLKYPVEFLKDNRSVILTGEAFFDIQKNPEKEFIINTEKSDVTVLGTSFNVRALEGETFTEVAVKTGRVQFRSKTNNQRTILEANQTATIENISGQLNETNTLNTNSINWQNNSLQFKNQTVEQVIEDLKRRFKFDVSLNNKALAECGFNGNYPNAQFKEILDDMVNTFGGTLMEDGKGKYILNGGECR